MFRYALINSCLTACKTTLRNIEEWLIKHDYQKAEFSMGGSVSIQ